MQQEALERLGATPVAMTLGDVLPAIQQGAIDGALAAITIYTAMQYYDAAKYVTESSGLPFIFSLAVMSKKWYDALPNDLQKIVDADGAKVASAVNPWELDFYEKQRALWREKGGELISLPADEQSRLMRFARKRRGGPRQGEAGAERGFRYVRIGRQGDEVTLLPAKKEE